MFSPVNGGSGVALSSGVGITFNPSSGQFGLGTGSALINGLLLGTSANTITTTSGNLTLNASGGTVLVGGNLNVQGTATYIDSTTQTITDPVIVLGSGAGGTHTNVTDTQDRGIEYRRFSGSAITGFFGLSNASGRFTFVPNANVTANNTYTGSIGVIEANITGSAITATNFYGTFVGNAASATTAGLATTAENLNITTTATGTLYPLFTSVSTTASGVAVSVDGTDISYDAATNTLTAGKFSGLASGTAATFTNIYGPLTGTATTAQNLNVVSSTSGTFYPLFTNISSTASGVAVSVDSGISWDSATDTLTAGKFSGLASGSAATFTNFYGTLTGNVTGTSTTSQNVNIVSATTGTFYPLFSNISTTASGVAISVDSGLSWNSATDTLTSGTFSGNLSATAATATNFYGTFVGSATTSTSLSVVLAATNASHQVLFTPTSGTASGVAVSTENSFVYNPSTDILSVSGLAVTSTTASTNSSTGALIVTGGVGIGQSVNISGRVGIGTNLLNAALNIQVPSTTTSGIILRGNGSQTSDAMTYFSASGSTQFAVDANGRVRLTGMDGIWNNKVQQNIFDVSDGRINFNLATWQYSSIYWFYAQASISQATGRLEFSHSGTSSTSGIGVLATGFGTGGGNRAFGILSPNGSERTYFNGYGNLVINPNNPNPLHDAWNQMHLLSMDISGTANTYIGNIILGKVEGTERFSVGPFGNTRITVGSATTATGLLVKAVASQSGNIIETQASTGVTNFYISPSGGASFSDNVEIKSAKEVRFNNSGNTFYTGFKAGSNASNTTYTLPIAFPGSGTSVLQSDTSGTLSWVGVVGSATTATNINVVLAATNASHQVLFTPTSGSASGVAVSTENSFVYNPSTDILSVSGLAVTASTTSTNSSTGALIVTGGMGIGGTVYTNTDLNVGTSTTGRLYFSQATLGSAGTTVIPSMAFIGTTNSPITLSVLADNSLSFDGSSGQLFSINNNLSTGWIFAVNDISGLPLIRANADGTVAMGEFAGNIGIGISNPSYKLHVVGDTNLSSTYVYRINGTSVLSASSLGTGVTNSSLTAVGTITTGTWAGSTITGLYGGTGYTNYTAGDILVGAGGTFIKLNAGSTNYVLTSNGSGAVPSWQAVPSSAASSVAVSPTATNSSFSITAVNSANGSGLGLSTIASFVVNPSTGIVSMSGLAVTASTTSTSSSTGALIVTGGVGIGGSLFTSTSFADSISGVVLSNGVITSGSWSGSTITAFYGGTGYNSYTKGDILVGAGSTFIKLNVGTDNYILSASSASATGLSWIANTGGGGAGTVYNGSLNAIPYYPAAGSAITGSVNFTNTGTSINIGYSTATTNTATGALTVVGGVGIGQTLFTSSSYASSISGVVLDNGIITFGTWSGSTITAKYGGTGYTTYTTGDLLVGAGSTFIKVGSGSTNYILSANSSLYPAGVGWTWVSAVVAGTNPPNDTHDSDLWWNSDDGSLNFYYNDGDTSQWVEIAGGSGIDLSQPVHITSTLGSTNVSTGALIVDGGVGVAGTVNAQSFVVNGTYDQIGTTLTTSATTANQVALTLNTSVYRSAKIFVQASSGSTYHSQEVMLLHDGSDVYMTEYAMVNSGAIGSTFDGDISGGNMRFLVTPTYAETVYKIACSAIRI